MKGRVPRREGRRGPGLCSHLPCACRGCPESRKAASRTSKSSGQGQDLANELFRGNKEVCAAGAKRKRQEAGNGTKTCLEGGMLGACSPVGCPTCSGFYVNGIETCSGVWNPVVTQSLRMQCITKRRGKGWEG